MNQQQQDPERRPSFQPRNAQEAMEYYIRKRKKFLWSLFSFAWAISIGMIILYYYRGMFRNGNFPNAVFFPISLVLVISAYVYWGLWRIRTGKYQPGGSGFCDSEAPQIQVLPRVVNVNVQQKVTPVPIQQADGKIVYIVPIANNQAPPRYQGEGERDD